MNQDVTAWLLCGGQGRRVGGQDKGLLPYHGRPLAQWVLRSLAPQTGAVHLNANRHSQAYAEMVQAQAASQTIQVLADDADVAGFLGPLAGILTGLRRTKTPWLMVAPCDCPRLPADLVERLHQDARRHGADIAVPVTPSTAAAEPDHHWVCALIHARCAASLEAAIRSGERRVGRWVQSQRWVATAFPDAGAFVNVNTLESLHAGA